MIKSLISSKSDSLTLKMQKSIHIALMQFLQDNEENKNREQTFKL